ncbi:MAG: TrkH family potassium uptake protein [Deltaproteobacteria bacterium]|nr:TrkH family potassium uptake protein [Deltaproteobacteria bacterium]
MVVNILGKGLFFMSLSLLIPLCASVYYQEDDLSSLALGALICGVAGAVMVFLSRRPEGELRHREGFLVVTLAWTLAGLFGAIPFRLSGYFASYIDAVFETVSGFTTTGATVLTNVEVLPHGLLLWRALTHWLGGMGIIVLTIAILPYLGVGGMQIFNAESPGPTVDKLKPRITETAKLLWGIYVGLTVLEAILLLAGGMGAFDAVCHSFATMATGGFSTKNASIGAYASPYIDAVVTVFMLIAGANFALHYAALTGNVKAYLHSHEFRWYLAIYSLACLFIMWNTRDLYPSFLQLLRYVTFQVSSILTTTGFATYDFIKWPVAAQIMLVLLMVIGGCAGSTSGGVKVMRLGILIKFAHREIFKLVHPHAVKSIKWDGHTVQPDVLQSILGFSIFYALILLVGTLLISMLGIDFTSSVSSVIACTGNVGPGLASVGPMGNFAHIPPAGKVILTFCMLVGRLEVYTILVVLSPAFWTR